MSTLRVVGALIVAATTILGTSQSHAEPTSGSVTVQMLRPYTGGNSVYVYLNGVGPCGQQSGAYNIYTIDLSSPSGKAAYAAALLAIATGKLVQIEVIAGACGSLYPGVQSVYLIQ